MSIVNLELENTKLSLEAAELARENAALKSERNRLFRVGGELERENAALRELLIMAKRYVPPQAVTNEWKTKPVADCRLIDKIELVLDKGTDV